MNRDQLLRFLHEEESGQDLLEYALVLAIVLVAVVAGSNDVAAVIGSALTVVLGRIQTIVQ